MNAAGLRSVTLEDWRPVQIEMEGERLALEECLRLLPGKRIAARAVYEGRTVFAKVMFGGGHEQLAGREMAILEQLWACDVPVPRPLALRHGEGMSVIITEWLGGAETVTDPIRRGDEQVLRALLTRIDRIYQAGFYQRDLHLDNFVLCGGSLRVLDAGVMARLPAARVWRERLQTRNLALLCAQASLDCAALLQAHIEDYFGFTAARRRAFAHALERARNRRIRHARRKWLRACSAVYEQHHDGTTVLMDRTLQQQRSQLLDLLRDPEKAPAIKRGSRIHVHATGAWVIKHYRDQSVRVRVKQWLGLHSSRRSWVMGWTLAMLGVPTPRPVAWLRERSGRNVLIYPRLEGPRLSELMEQDPEYARTVTPKVLSWLRLMGETGCWHGDTKAQNVLIIQDAPWLIDLDAAGWSPHAWRSRQRHRNDLHRFRTNRTQFVPPDHRHAGTGDGTREAGL